MYIAVNIKLARSDLARALKWSIRTETITDMIKELAKEEQRTGQKWYNYVIFTV